MTGTDKTPENHSFHMRVLYHSMWLLPVVLFLVSGIPKIIHPSGAMPKALLKIIETGSYDTLMRSVGALEVILAMMVVLPATRRLGLILLLGLVSVFSIFVAMNAHDFSFVSNCGCFSAVEVSKAESSQTYFGLLILRNTMIVIVLLLGLKSNYGFSSTPMGRFSLARFQTVIMIALLALAIPMAIGEFQLRLNSYRSLDAILEGHDRFGYFGKTIPNFGLVDAKGHQTNTLKALQADDHLFFLSTSCPHCEQLGPAIKRLQHELAEKGSRVVVLLTDTQSVSMGFLEHIGLSDILVYAIPSKADLLRLGITAVPRMMILGGDSQVLFNESYPHASTFWKSINLCNQRAPGASVAVYDVIVKEIFGEEAHCNSAPIPNEYYYEATVVNNNKLHQQLFVVQGGTKQDALLELAIGITDSTHIAGIVPLSAGAYVRAIDPGVTLVDTLVGRTIAEALTYSRAQAQQPALEKRIWKSVVDALLLVSFDLGSVFLTV